MSYLSHASQAAEQPERYQTPCNPLALQHDVLAPALAASPTGIRCWTAGSNMSRIQAAVATAQSKTIGSDRFF